MGLVVTWSTSTLVGWLLSVQWVSSLTGVSGCSRRVGRSCHPPAADVLRRGGRASSQYNSTTRQADHTTIELLSHTPSLIIKIITDRNILASHLTVPDLASAS